MSSGASSGIGIVPIVSIIALFGALFWYVRSSLRRVLENVAGVFDEGSGTPSGLMANRMTGHVRGREAQLRVTPQSKSQPKKFHIRLECRSGLTLRVGHEWPGARLASRWGLLRDVQTGSADLDGRFVFSSSQPDRLRDWVRSNPALATTFITLFDRGVDELRANEKELRATLVAFDDPQVQPGNVREILDALGPLARALEQT